MAQTKEEKNAYARAWFARNPGYASRKSKEFRNKHPEYSAEWAKANPEKRRRYTRKWAAAHKDYLNFKAHERHAKDPEKRRARDRKARAANPLPFREYDRARYASNPTRKRVYSRKWKRKNPDKVRDHNRVRRARKRVNGLSAYTPKQWRELKAFYDYKCLGCGLSETEIIDLGRVLVGDHVVPLAKGGSNDISNIQPLCHGTGGCNLKKGARHIDYRSKH